MQDAIRHVLVVDADPASVAYGKRALGGMDVEAVATPPAALERVVGSAFDAVLLDPALGDDDDGALALLHRMRTVAPDTVVVIWSAQPTVEFTVRAMRAGRARRAARRRRRRPRSARWSIARSRTARSPARCAGCAARSSARAGSAR